MRLSHALQSSLPEQILSALVNAVCFNDSKMFMIATLSFYMGSSQRLMKSIPSFNIRTVPVLRLIYKFWLKTWIFSNIESLSKCFSGVLFRFLIFLVISQNYSPMKIKSTNGNGEFRALAYIKDRVLCHDS